MWIRGSLVNFQKVINIYQSETERGGVRDYSPAVCVQITRNIRHDVPQQEQIKETERNRSR